ncbi:glucose/sorbosone family PQQ-dependent dehydrogenase [Devosia sp. CN2-171]|uniref:glucose/sorbosone family PQQ-dependent dehydrogenase n=1 Tax=Devosia sp. CN2-171 TaxID=3400909 RepID=UPI003BF832E7
MRFVATFAFALTAVLTAAPALAQGTPDSAVVGTKQFEMKELTNGLEGPWEITWGPDGWLWVTERTGGKITRVNPADGTKQVAIDIEEVSAPGGQDGLLGMALDPGLLKGTGNDYVYASYTYVDKTRGGIPWVADPFSPYHDLWVKIVRLTYDEATGTLKDPVDIIAGMPAKNDHNSGRLKFGPDAKLYYTIGDGGKGQLGNWCIPIEAQRLPTADEMANKNWMAYQGKTLRLNLDGSIPDDNPELDGVKSHVLTYGHRNAQGIDFGPDGTLYASEQGPKTDDEVNVLVAGENYGWPRVAGFKDDMAYQYARWDLATTPCEQLTFSDITIDPSVPVEDETSWPGEQHDPLATLFTVPNDWNFQDPACGGIDFICWPTVAASSMQAYFPAAGEGIPGWENSLLVTTLKRGSIYRIPLAEDGKTVSGPIERYFQSENRLRDMALSPDMKTMYIATDVSGLVGTMDGGAGTVLKNPGAILVYTYTGEGDGTAAAATTEAAPSAEAAATAATGAPVTFTAEQAARGKTAYDANCVSCHGPDLISANYGPPLAGAYFDGKWIGQTAAALYTHTHDRMPPSRPGQLGDQTYADLVAYILQVNGLAAGDTELPPDVAALETMVISR